jgi:hypothetical protein
MTHRELVLRIQKDQKGWELRCEFWCKKSSQFLGYLCSLPGFMLLSESYSGSIPFLCLPGALYGHRTWTRITWIAALNGSMSLGATSQR